MRPHDPAPAPREGADQAREGGPAAPGPATREIVLAASEHDRGALTAILQRLAGRVVPDQDPDPDQDQDLEEPAPALPANAPASEASPLASPADRASPPPRPALAAVVSDGAPDPLERCRRHARSGPVILVSDETGFEFRVAAARSGVTALVRRPVNAIEMAEWLQYFADRQGAAAFTVLIVDDDWLTAEVAAAVLRSDGITVVTVSDATLALPAIEEHRPDLILMDIQMPGVDGIELTRVIRQARQFFSVPIIFLSAERDEARQIEARRLGGDDFFPKPIVPDRLIALVRLRADRARHLRAMIERDRLTGLYDPTAFRERLAHELHRCARTGAELTLALIDLDHFKRVNDRHGHLAGDHVLRTLAATLVSGLRGIDIAGRCGGEEFGVVLLDTAADHAAQAIDRIRQSFARIAFGGAEGPFNVTFSAGVAASSASSHQLLELLSAADGALYASKRTGRNRVATPHGPLHAPPPGAVTAALDTPERTEHVAA